MWSWEGIGVISKEVHNSRVSPVQNLKNGYEVSYTYGKAEVKFFIEWCVREVFVTQETIG